MKMLLGKKKYQGLEKITMRFGTVALISPAKDWASLVWQIKILMEQL